MADPSQVHHEIDYIELAVTDLVEAKRFYGEAFGWAFTDYRDAYAGIRRGSGGEVGGLRLDDAVEPGGPLVILYSGDLEGSATSVGSLRPCPTPPPRSPSARAAPPSRRESQR